MPILPGAPGVERIDASREARRRDRAPTPGRRSWRDRAWTIALVALATLPCAALAADASAFSGVAKVVDGDTLEVAGRHVRLYGIDAPEGDQTCRDAGDRVYACGARATAALAGKIDGSRVRCEPRDRDGYGRIVAVCFVDDQNLNRWMVAQGWALAYRHYSGDYIGAEESAQRASLGIWSGSFEKPWRYRHARRQSAGARPAPQGETPSAGCRIKGNINGDGDRIYHVPGQQHYAQTRISAPRGERWFCTEDEARAAGWRRARN